MKIQQNKKAGAQGSALVITIVLGTILATLIGSYFCMIQTQHFSVARSQSWNQALTVAEAGVEEALALLNSGVQPPNFAVFPWTSSGGGVFQNDTNRPACKFGNCYYQRVAHPGAHGQSGDQATPGFPGQRPDDRRARL